jgi:hypothetical protein
MADVCSNCGQPINPKTRKCYRCVGHNPPAPDLADIRARCAIIQAGWTAHTRASRLSPIYRTDELTIPSVHQVTDGMRRNAEHGD